jgi:stearoyl-CoA desaturase (delta-9 desaturase)
MREVLLMSTVIEHPAKVATPRQASRANGDRQRKLDAAQRDRLALVDAYDSTAFNWGEIDWVVTGFLVAMHVGCFAAPFFFSWAALGVCLVLHWLTCSVGICLGYHRYVSHQSMKLRQPARFLVLACGAIAGEGSPLNWAATHRLHHQKSDQEGDPHSPLDEPWWAHALWLFSSRKNEVRPILYRRYVPELVGQPMLKFFERTYALWLWAVGLTLLAAGWLLGGWKVGLSIFLWGMCVRMTVAYHSTWLINSATHLWGYRNYKTRDESRNLWWVALLAYGEGWHNNHHAHPSVAPAGHRWWEVDMTWWVIRSLRAVGLAYDVKDRIPAKGSSAGAP